MLHQTIGPELWGARKVGVIPSSFTIPPAPHPHNKYIFDSVPIWKEYELYKRARNERKTHVLAESDQHQLHVNHEGPNIDIDYYPVVDE